MNFNPMKQFYSLEELNAALESNTMAVVYYSNDACNVCKVLKPKIIEMIAADYPKVELIYIDTEKSPVIAGQFRVFTIPTIDIYVEGKEHLRFSRNVTMHDFQTAIEKPYAALLQD